MKTERFEKKWFKTETEANEFAKLIEGTVYEADFFGGYIVQYPANTILRRYVFEERRDRKGIGSEKIFVDPIEAVNYAKKEWNAMDKADKDSYYKDPAPTFYVYKIEITSTDLAEYLKGTPDFNLSERCSAGLWDYKETN